MGHKLKYVSSKHARDMPFHGRGRHGCTGAIVRQNTAQLIPFGETGGARALHNISPHPEVPILRDWLAFIGDRLASTMT